MGKETGLLRRVASGTNATASLEARWIGCVVNCRPTSGLSEPLKSAAAQPQAVRLTRKEDTLYPSPSFEPLRLNHDPRRHSHRSQAAKLLRRVLRPVGHRAAV